MNRIRYTWLMAAICLFYCSSFGQGTAFFYQGQLNSGGAAANGYFNFKFTLFNAGTNGTQVGDSLTNYDIPVSNGLFTTTLDFGPDIFTGSSLWLSIGVCTTNAGTNFTTLSPLQPVLPVPYAIFANAAENLFGTVPASQLTGTLPASAFAGYTNTVALTNGANLFAGSFSGNGAGVTNVSVTNLTGVLADAQLPNNTAFLNSNQTFTASNTFNGANIFTNLYGNSFSGSFFGNGLVGWVPVSGATVQAQVDHGYVLTNSQMVTVTLPATASAGDIVRIAGAGASGWQVAQNAGQSILGNFLNFGKSWLPSTANDLNWVAIASSSDGVKMAAAYAGTGGDGVGISSDSGQVWSASSLSVGETWQAIASSADGTKLVVVPNGNSIYSSTNSGSSWINNSTAGYDWTGVAYTGNGNNFVAVASGQGIYTNNGTTWTKSYSYGSGNTWTAISLATGGSELVAANSGYGIFVSMNAGASWTPVDTSQSFSWSCIASSAGGNRMIAGVSSGGLYISTNSGTSFTEVSALPKTVAWSGVASSPDGSKLVAVVNGGDLYTSSNWGATWVTNATSASWTGVVYPANGTTLAAVINDYSSSGGIYDIYTSPAGVQTVTTTGTSGYISGAQGSAVELECIGNNQFMPVSSVGTIWGN